MNLRLPSRMLCLAFSVFILDLLIAPSPVDAQGFLDHKSGLQRSSGPTNNGPLLGPGTYLGPIRPNAYGPGINADATGRPFQWQPEGIPPTGPDPTLRVTPNAYGLGVHADQYGRIVQPVCPFGQSMC